MKKLLFFIILLSIYQVSAISVCFPEGDALCSTKTNFSCVCINATIISNEYYCDIDNVVSCPNGCIAGECIGNPSQCIETFEKCQDNSVFRCVEGIWNKIKDCTIQENCVESSSYYADCNIKIYYCVGPINCFSKSVKDIGCYDTEEQCKANIGFCCKDLQNSVYTWRLGSCLTNEQSIQGTDINQSSCQAENTKNCKILTPEECGNDNGNAPNCFRKDCESCGWFYVDPYKWYDPFTWYHDGKCYSSAQEILPTCKDCDSYALSYFLGDLWKSKKCESKGWSFSWNPFKILPQGIQTCTLSIFKIILIPIIFIFGFLFLNDFLSKFGLTKGDKNKRNRYIISLIIVSLICFLFYTYLFLGLVLFLILVGIRFIR